MKYMFWKRLYKMCQPSKEGVKCLPHLLNLLSGYKNASINIVDFLNTDLHLIIAQRNIVNDHQTLINSFSWSLILCVSCSNSWGAMDEEVWDPLEADPK